MSTQYRLVQSGKTASGGCSAGQGSSESVAPRIYFIILFLFLLFLLFASFGVKSFVVGDLILMLSIQVV
jgi:hypothetical protein